jgi:hypothetical protein
VLAGAADDDGAVVHHRLLVFFNDSGCQFPGGGDSTGLPTRLIVASEANYPIHNSRISLRGHSAKATHWRKAKKDDLYSAECTPDPLPPNTRYGGGGQNPREKRIFLAFWSANWRKGSANFSNAASKSS